MWKTLFLNNMHVSLMLDCRCSRHSCALKKIIALYKLGNFQDIAQATCPFSGYYLINSSSSLLDTGSGSIFHQKISFSLIDKNCTEDYHVAINLLMLILLAKCDFISVLCCHIPVSLLPSSSLWHCLTGF